MKWLICHYYHQFLICFAKSPPALLISLNAIRCANCDRQWNCVTFYPKSCSNTIFGVLSKLMEISIVRAYARTFLYLLYFINKLYWCLYLYVTILPIKYNVMNWFYLVVVWLHEVFRVDAFHRAEMKRNKLLMKKVIVFFLTKGNHFGFWLRLPLYWIEALHYTI